jgi:septum formation topological specificity factor MinE
LDRELNTQKEIMRQMENTKKEYIDRLKKELDSIEGRYLQLVNDNIMVGEDYRSQAAENVQVNLELRRVIAVHEDTIVDLNETIE